MQSNDGFAWFLYRTLVDPGTFLEFGLQGPDPGAPSVQTHAEFAALVHSLPTQADLGRALASLFSEADYLAWLRYDPTGWWGWSDGVPGSGEPTSLRRMRLKTAVAALRGWPTDGQRPE